MTVPRLGGRIEPEAGHEVVVDAQARRPDGSQLWALHWERPEGRPGARWECGIVVAHDGAGRTELACAVRERGGRPGRFEPCPPPAPVRVAIEQLCCSAGGRQVLTTATTLFEHEVPQLVAALLDPARELPVVLVSQGSRELPLTDPRPLAERLAGVAHVYVLEDGRSSFALTEALGKPCSCYLGAVRIYWPGFARTDDPFTHPLLVPERLEELARRGESAADELHRRIALAAGQRFRPGPIAARLLAEARPAPSSAVVPQPARSGRLPLRVPPVRRAAGAAAAPEVAGSPAAAAAPTAEAPAGTPAAAATLPPDAAAAPPAGPAAGAAPAAALEAAAPAGPGPDAAYLAELARENEEVRAYARAAEERALELELQVEELREECGRLHYQLRAAQQGPGPGAPAAAAPPLRTLADAVAIARAELGERLLLLPTAELSAAASPYRRPDRALQALRALAEVAGLRRAGEAVGSLSRLFALRGFDYRAHESMTARGRWGSEYEVLFEGRKVGIEQHLALGTGGAEACLRIHFFWEEGSRRYAVAHVGRHKTNTKS